MVVDKFKIGYDENGSRVYTIEFFSSDGEGKGIFFNGYVYLLGKDNLKYYFKIIEVSAIDNIKNYNTAILTKEITGYNDIKNKIIDPKEWVFDKIYKHE